VALSDLGLVWHCLGDDTQARATLTESLALYHTLGATRDVIDCLERQAEVLAALGHAARAVTLLSVAHTLRVTLQAPPSPYHQDAPAQVREAARSVLGDAAFLAAWAEGQALSLEEAIHLAVDQ
jgi:hypothetical protein